MLEQLSSEFVFHFMLIFARIGSAFSVLPGISSAYLLMQARLGFVLAVSLIMLPSLGPYLPHYEGSITFSVIVSYMAIEILIGVLIGIAANIYMQSIHFVGQVLSMQSGLGSAAFFDPTQQEQVAIFSNFLMIATIALIFASDTHYLFLSGVADSYVKFPPGELPDSGDMSSFIVKCVNDSFILAFKLASPFLVVSLAILTGSGLLSRLMPNLQVFFVITPAQILVMFGVFYIVIFSIISKVVETIALTVQVISI